MIVYLYRAMGRVNQHSNRVSYDLALVPWAGEPFVFFPFDQCGDFCVFEQLQVASFNVSVVMTSKNQKSDPRYS